MKSIVIAYLNETVKGLSQFAHDSRHTAPRRACIVQKNVKQSILENSND